MSENVGVSTSRNPKGLHALYRDNFTLTTPKFSFYVMMVIKISYEAWNLSPATISLIPRHKHMIHCIILINEADFKYPFLMYR
jgi:hypothetical protein